MSFNLCCNSRHPLEYDLIHSLNFDPNINQVLLNGLWKLPEIQSYQSNSNTMFSNDVYDDFFMQLLKNTLELNDDDIKIVSGEPAISSTDAEYYDNSICSNCSKLLFSKRAKYTTVNEFFNHLRNSIAHGCFNIVGDTFIGFDHPRFHGEKWTAVIKVKYSKLAQAINIFSNMTCITDIYRNLLIAQGYNVTILGDEMIAATKGAMKYHLVVKQYNGRYLEQKDIQEFFNEYREYDNKNHMFVLVVDSTYITKDIKLYLVGHNIAVIDKNSLKSMIKGTDYLAVLSNEHKWV